MSTIAELLVRVGVLDETEKGLDSASAAIGKTADKMVGAGKTMSRNVTLPIVAAGTGLFMLAQEAEEAQAKLGSSFDSMGASAWTSVDALNAQAEALQDATTFDDEGIANFQSVLLTFGNVTGDVFTDATRLGLDMSAKLGTDLQSSAIQLGKALNDPVKGVTALTRVGVSFTQEQKEMIKSMQESGDLAGAQAVIMGELEKQFGGTAEAMAETNTGQAKQAMNALANAGESIALVVAPAFGQLAKMIKGAAEWFQGLPGPVKNVIVVLGAVAAAIGPVLIVGGKLIKGFLAIQKAFGALSAVMAANPWILLVAATVALVVLIVKNWDKIVAFLKRTWDWIKKAATAVWDWVKAAFQRGVDFIKNLFLNLTLAGLIIKHWDKIKAAATAVKDWIVGAFNAVVSFFSGLPRRISNAVSGMWDGIKNAFRSALNWVIGKWNNFKITFPSISLPWGGKIGGFTINTPNIPKLHTGGVFNAPGGQREGLALLEDGERVIPRGGTSAATITIGNVYGWDDFVRKIREANVDIRQLGLT